MSSGNPNDLWNQLSHAIELIAKQDQVVWVVFGVFWGANAVLLVALFTNGALPDSIVGIVVSAAGLALSIVWALIHRRVCSHLHFYEGVMQRLEELLKIPKEVALSGKINTVHYKEALKGSVRVRPITEWCPIVVAFLWAFALWWFIDP